MSDPTIEDRLEWTIADNVKKAIEIERLEKQHTEFLKEFYKTNEENARLEKLVDDIAYTAKNRKNTMRKYRRALRSISLWSQEAQDQATKMGVDACIMQWRGCVAEAILALKEDK